MGRKYENLTDEAIKARMDLLADEIESSEEEIRMMREEYEGLEEELYGGERRC